MARILLIEDDAAVAESIRDLLMHSGYEVTWVSNGRPALQQHAIRPFDLIVSDIIMPDMEGIETIRSLRAAKSDVPIIAISGGSSMSPNYLLGLAAEFGSAATFTKPILSGPFLAKVEELLSPECPAH